MCDTEWASATGRAQKLDGSRAAGGTTQAPREVTTAYKSQRSWTLRPNVRLLGEPGAPLLQLLQGLDERLQGVRPAPRGGRAAQGPRGPDPQEEAPGPARAGGRAEPPEAARRYRSGGGGLDGRVGARRARRVRRRAKRRWAERLRAGGQRRTADDVAGHGRGGRAPCAAAARVDGPDVADAAIGGRRRGDGGPTSRGRRRRGRVHRARRAPGAFLGHRIRLARASQSRSVVSAAASL